MFQPPPMTSDQRRRRRRISTAILITPIALALVTYILLRSFRTIDEVSVVIRGIPPGFQPRNIVAESSGGSFVNVLWPTIRSTSFEANSFMYDGPYDRDPFKSGLNPLQVYVEWRDVRRLGIFGYTGSRREVICWFTEEDSQAHRWPWIFSPPECRIDMGKGFVFEDVPRDLFPVLNPRGDALPASPAQQQLWLQGDLEALQKYIKAESVADAAQATRYLRDACLWVARNNAALSQARRDFLADEALFARISSAVEAQEWSVATEELVKLEPHIARLNEK